MKELRKILEELAVLYKEKEKECNEKPNFNSYVQSELNNKKRKIEIFQTSIDKVSNDPFLKNEIINNFKRDAEQIKSEIGQITC